MGHFQQLKLVEAQKKTCSYCEIAVVIPQCFHFICGAGWVDCGGQQDVDDVPHVVHRVSSMVRGGGGGHFYDGVDP